MIKDIEAKINRLEEFRKEEISQGQNDRNVINYNFTNSNLSINSPYSNQILHIENEHTFDKDTLNLLKDLRDSINKKDKGMVFKILGFIADKSFDLFVAILAGKVLKS